MREPIGISGTDRASIGTFASFLLGGIPVPAFASTEPLFGKPDPSKLWNLLWFLLIIVALGLLALLVNWIHEQLERRSELKRRSHRAPPRTTPIPSTPLRPSQRERQRFAALQEELRETYSLPKGVRTPATRSRDARASARDRGALEARIDALARGDEGDE